MGLESFDLVRFHLGFSFKVKRCLNGFGEFSFWWIQLHQFSEAIGLVHLSVVCTV